MEQHSCAIHLFGMHGNASDGARVLAHMIVHGIKGYMGNVDPKVFDVIFAIENGRMEIQTT